MAKFNQLLFFSLMLLFLVSSCGKYENGPVLSFLSKEKRLCRTWKLERIELYIGQDSVYVEGDVYPFELKFEKSGQLTYTYQQDSQSITQVSNWTWLLGTFGLTLDLNQNIHQGNIGIRNYEIRRLTKKELWIYDRATGNNYYLKSE